MANKRCLPVSNFKAPQAPPLRVGYEAVLTVGPGTASEMLEEVPPPDTEPPAFPIGFSLPREQQWREGVIQEWAWFKQSCAPVTVREFKRVRRTVFYNMNGPCPLCTGFHDNRWTVAHSPEYHQHMVVICHATRNRRRIPLLPLWFDENEISEQPTPEQ